MRKDEFTLDQLAAAVGMTARNVRAYRTKGLIPAPWRSGRRSVYGLEHLRRLQAIERARQQGASLSLIAAHLAAGRALDDGALVDWVGPGAASAGLPPPGHPAVHGTGVAELPYDIAPLLAQPDGHHDATTQADLDELAAAGVLRPEGVHLYTGRELAQSLVELQRRGVPLPVALGIAQLMLTAATPVASALREVTEAVDGPERIRRHLGDVACYVLQHLISHPGSEEAMLPTSPDDHTNPQ